MSASAKAFVRPKPVSTIPSFSFQVRALDFARILHPRGNTGQVAFGGPVPSKKLGKDGKPRHVWADRRWSPYAIDIRDVDIAGAKFISMASYTRHERGQPKPSKNEANIVAIGHNWVDLDYYDVAEWAGTPPAEVREAIFNVCEDLGIPSPSLITSSGQGLLVVWSYDAQRWCDVGPRWKAVQDTLHFNFKPFGSDPSGRTPTKWFRIPGTRNEKSGRAVSLIWPNTTAEIRRTGFDELAAFVLPHARKTKAQKEAEAAARSGKVKVPRKPRPTQIGGKINGITYWRTLSTDLDRLFDLRFGAGPIPDGKARDASGAGRNAWIICLAYAAAWNVPAAELDDYVLAQAERCGLSEDEALDKTATIRSHAQQAARGVTKIWGKDKLKTDMRYRPSPRYFREFLNIQPREENRANLRMLIGPARRHALALERAMKSRRNAGVGSRSVSQDTRRAVGMAALDMKAMGLRNAEVCQVFGVEDRYLDSCLRDARAVVAICKTRKAKPVSVPAPAVDKILDAPMPVPADLGEPVLAASGTSASTEVPPAHETLRGTGARVPDLVIDLAGDGERAYRDLVTTVGTYLSPDGRPLSASRPGGRSRVRTAPNLVPA